MRRRCGSSWKSSDGKWSVSESFPKRNRRFVAQKWCLSVRHVWCNRFRGMFLMNFSRTKKFNSFLRIVFASKAPRNIRESRLELNTFGHCLFTFSLDLLFRKPLAYRAEPNNRCDEEWLKVESINNSCFLRRWPSVNVLWLASKVFGVRKSNFFFSENISWLECLEVSKIAAPLDPVALVSWLECNNVLSANSRLLLALICFHFWHPRNNKSFLSWDYFLSAKQCFKWKASLVKNLKLKGKVYSKVF